VFDNLYLNLNLVDHHGWLPGWLAGCLVDWLAGSLDGLMDGQI